MTLNTSLPSLWQGLAPPSLGSKHIPNANCTFVSSKERRMISFDLPQASQQRPSSFQARQRSTPCRANLLGESLIACPSAAAPALLMCWNPSKGSARLYGVSGENLRISSPRVGPPRPSASARAQASSILFVVMSSSLRVWLVLRALPIAWHPSLPKSQLRKLSFSRDRFVARPSAKPIAPASLMSKLADKSR